MRTDDVFNDIDSRTADRLAKEYPVLRDEQKERLYAMSKRKFDIKIDNSSIDVSGVEKYRRPKWFKGVSVAAAALLLVSGIGGSMYYISRSGWRASVEIVGTLAETTEVTTEAITEEQTEAEEADADAIAKELTGAYRDFVNDLQGGGLKVDKSSVVTKNRMLINDEIHKDFYRVTDPRYSTWADIEKRCFEIFDTDLGQEILDFISFHDEEHMSQNSYIYTSDNGYYIETSIIDCDNGTIEWDEYTAKEEFDENGNIIATIIDKYSQSFSGSDSIIEFTFTIVNTENGWRISDVTEKPLDDSIEDSTDADAIAKGLIDDYKEFMYTLHAGDIEVDKSDIITKTIKTEDGQYEYQLKFYRVTDPRYPTWADIEKRCLEILDNELGHKVLEICSDIDEDFKKHTFVCTTDNGYYIEKGLHDIGVETLKWEGYDLNSEFDENGNIIAAIRHTHQFESQNITLETTFTIVNTENGWRISDVTEKPLDDSIEDSTDAE
ncbi:hypothetical protein [Ruminococcus flavefaciens]|uniref:hypothetical protein n=1 Tax=Ruminococcus flavefaciens TaxID=1265 RepID=UPI0026EA00E9|nr:hypothetical protein [Ruminococcus flavefaciens]